MTLQADKFVLRWPWAALDTLTGGMPAGGRPIYVVGFSGMGKSCFLNSALIAWAEQGVKVDVLPLETTPKRFKLNIAALEGGIDPGLLASGDYLRLPDAIGLRRKANAAWQHCAEGMFWQDTPAHWQNPIRINESEGMDLARLTEAFALAVERNAQVLCVDHVDHLTEAADTFASTTVINRAAQRLAMETGIVTILMSQANNDALKGNSDHLAKFAPLRDSSVWMGGLKRQLASGVLGLFRPLREPARDESEEDWLRKVKAARSGKEAPSTVLLSGAFGLSLMKSENYGSREGSRALLGWQHGRIVDYFQPGWSER